MPRENVLGQPEAVEHPLERLSVLAGRGRAATAPGQSGTVKADDGGDQGGRAD